MAHLTLASLQKLPGNNRLVGDDRTQNLYVRKTAGGVLTWVFKRQRKLDGKMKWDERVIGRAPRMTLEQARAEATRLRAEDTGLVAPTWESASEAFLAAQKKEVQAAALRNTRRILLDHFGELKDTRLDVLDRKDVLRVIDRFRAEGKDETALKLLGRAKAMTRHALVWGLIDRDPLDALDKKIQFAGFKSNVKKRTLKPDEIRKLWADDSKSAFVLWFQLLTGTRAEEALSFDPKDVGDETVRVRRGGKLEDVEFKNVWTLRENKSSRVHKIPLSPQALALIESGYPPEITYSGVHQWVTSKHGFNTHDCRRTCATMVKELTGSTDTMHAVLNHARSKLDETYDQSLPLAAMREALDLVGAELERIATAPAKK